MSFRYVHTTSSVLCDNRLKLLNDYAEVYLYSLINGLSNNKYQYGLSDVVKKIQEFYNLSKKYNKELWVDSGGYSIITGEVDIGNPEKMKVDRFVDNVYIEFLKTYAKDYCDKIFSLDIPIFLNSPERNTVENIYNYNLDATIKSKKILDENPELYEKYIYVWQFKLQKQFNIWRDIYKNIFTENNNIKHHAIGGLVGIRGITNIKFSPYIGMAYRILKLIKDKNLPQESILHILGVYGRQDRFTMQFLDRLFNKHYLKNSNSKIAISFDTINYTISGFFRVRNMPLSQIPLIDIEENTIVHNPKGFEKHLDVLIKDEKVRNIIIEEMKEISEGKPTKDLELLSLTYVIYSHLLDYIMAKAIDDYKLVDRFLECKNGAQVKNRFEPIVHLLATQYPFVFEGLQRNLMANFEWVSNFHHGIWLKYDEDLEKIDKMIELFIKAIGFPFDLIGDFSFTN